MRSNLATLGVGLEMACRNLLANGWKTAIVGGVIGLAALLMVVGSSLTSAIDQAMRRSITGSIAGQLQVYSAASKDAVDLAAVGVEPNLAPIDDFAALHRALLAVPDVSAVVPMALDVGMVSTGNAVDQALSALRSALAERGDDYTARKARVRHVLEVLRMQLENAAQVTERTPPERLAELQRAVSEAFWSSFDADPYAHLETLENRVAPLAVDPDAVVVRYVGTDPAAYARAFDRMYIVDGEAIPPGKRGFMFSKYGYEERFKLKAARGLDKLKAAIDERAAKIATDPELQRIVRENTLGVRELLLQLDPAKSDSVRRKLQQFLRTSEGDVAELMTKFFATDDENFQERHRFFYAELASDFELYRVKVGEMLTLRALSRSGYLRSTNLKVYGTYSFRGLERSPQAGAIDMMDLVSFRELHELITGDRNLEFEALRAAAGATTVAREAAEDALFATKHTAAAATAAEQGPEDALPELRGTRGKLEQAAHESYGVAQLEQGPILNAAVLLHDESELDNAVRAIELAAQRAGFSLKIAPWQQASGILGQFATLIRGVLLAAVSIIFVVGLVVICNALVMATLERAKEIGTLRALGAQRRFILTVLVLESSILGLIAGTIGACLGGLLLMALQRSGIPARDEAIAFVFSGPRLFPSAGLPELIFALGAVLAISILAGLYPGWLGMRVSPREAMQGEE